jgi:hypothetical protein
MNEEQGTPTEDEIRAQIEDELRRVRVEDLMLQTISGLLNLSVRRIAKEDERDLEQAQAGIDAVRAWVDLLPEEAGRQVRQALSELQVLYAKQADAGPGDTGGEPGEGGEEEEPEAGGEPPPPQPPPAPEPGRGREPPPRLWTPPGTS